MTLTNSERVDKQQLVGIQHRIRKNEGPVIGSGGQSAHRPPICYNLLQYNIHGTPTCQGTVAIVWISESSASSLLGLKKIMLHAAGGSEAQWMWTQTQLGGHSRYIQIYTKHPTKTVWFIVIGVKTTQNHVPSPGCGTHLDPLESTGHAHAPASLRSHGPPISRSARGLLGTP